MPRNDLDFPTHGGEFASEFNGPAFGELFEADHAAFLATVEAMSAAEEAARKNHASAPFDSGPDNNCKWLGL